MNFNWSPTRQAGAERLQEFVASSGKTKEHDSSGLSPYLAHRLLTDSEVVSAMLEEHKPAEVEGFLGDLLWRTYWKGWLEGRPQVYSNWQRLVSEDSRRWPEREDYRAAIEGKTGLEVFDHWVGQLKNTGFLSHEERRCFASIWLFTFKLPWSLGVSFFLENLLDGDVAATILSWRTVAGLHTKGKHFLVGAEKIKSCTGGEFDPSGKLTESAGPLSGFPNPPYKSPLNFPFSASHQLGEKYALVLSGDDLSPELGATSSMKPSLILRLSVEDAYRALSLSEKCCRFKNEAMEDAARRAEAHYGVESEVLQLGDDAPGALKAMMDSKGLTSLVYYEPFVGPWKQLTAALSSRDVGVKFFPLRRPWDGLLHPHAVKSYIHFKKHAYPQVMRTKGSFHAPVKS